VEDSDTEVTRQKRRKIKEPRKKMARNGKLDNE